MIKVARPHHSQVDWDEWVAPLDQFAQATGLTVSAFDTNGVRTVGPLIATRVARLLRSSTLWNDEGPGTALEQRAVSAVVSGQQPPDEQMQLHGLRFTTLPLTQFGKVYGVLVFGWCFRDFSSPMACEQVARLVGLSGQALWTEVRLEAPVSDTRMATNTALMRSLAGSIDRQRETIEQLNRVSRTRELFLAAVSHEMRTPLSALSMRLELMLRTIPDLPAAVESGLNSMRVHVRQEAAMVEDLIDAARTLTGQMSIESARVPLGRIVRDAVSTIEVNAHEKQIAFSVTPADYGDGIMISGDPRRLQQVLWNLLLNAIKFTPPGGSIGVRIAVGATRVKIDVSDSGEGIAAEDLEHVFGAFTLQTHANASGLGLGLYIARRIVELHGGTLTVASPGKGCGTTFSIHLPMAPKA